MPLAGLTIAEAAGQHSPSPAAAVSQLKKEIRSLKRELAAAKEALRARESTPPSRRKREREEESPAMSSAEKRARGQGVFPKGDIASPCM
jgi:hypothetical protein